MYVMVCMRPNTVHSERVVSRYMGYLEKQHWKVMKRIMRYMRSTSDACMCFKASDGKLEELVNVDLASDVDTTGYV